MLKAKPYCFSNFCNIYSFSLCCCCCFSHKKTKKLRKENKPKGVNKITTESLTSLQQNLLLITVAAFGVAAAHWGEHRRACLSAQCGIKHSASPLRGFVGSHTWIRSRTGRFQAPGETRDLQRTGKIGKNIDFDISSHFQRVEMPWQPHLSNQMLPEVPSIADTPETLIPTKLHAEWFILGQSNQQHFCFFLCLISLVHLFG